MTQRRQKIEYGLLVENALRTVVRKVLRELADDKVPAPHHFYITFKTAHPGVELADFLRQRYPTEMTIVLQHQYWDLEVREEDFSVTLSFNDQAERMKIPFEAIKVFADPGVEFGLQFTIEPDASAAGINDPVQLKAQSKPVLHQEEGEEKSESSQAGAEIVTLDQFRKK